MVLIPKRYVPTDPKDIEAKMYKQGVSSYVVTVPKDFSSTIVSVSNGIVRRYSLATDTIVFKPNVGDITDDLFEIARMTIEALYTKLTYDYKNLDSQTLAEIQDELEDAYEKILKANEIFNEFRKS